MQIPSQARVVRLQAGSNPLLAVIVALITLVLGLALILLLLPFALVAAVIAAVYITIRRALARIGRPNSSVAGVRTDGRDNVRVITRE